jgi:mersacidin/lichenicidin family type 2 lantibiotic
MSSDQIVRAWRDYDFWLSLGAEERARIPDNPAGVIELMDAELEAVAGGSDTSDTCGSCLSCYTGGGCYTNHTNCCY